MYTDNDILFPPHGIPSLKNLRGDMWRDLVERVTAYPESHEETLAFVLLMIRLNGCMNCETDSYRAMRGCIACAHQTLRRYKGNDCDLIELFDKALHDVRAFAQKNDRRDIVMATLP